MCVDTKLYAKFRRNKIYFSATPTHALAHLAHLHGWSDSFQISKVNSLFSNSISSLSIKMVIFSLVLKNSYRTCMFT
jgi:hypothetical protein